ncbi:integral membrane transport protein [Bifidobacterium breve]|nr:integral membrane transport protein [Bifidobacterium breve]
MSATTSAQPAQLTRNERLDRLPFNKAHRKLLVASGVGWAFDAMDVGLVSFVVAFILACIAALCLPERKGLNLED